MSSYETAAERDAREAREQRAADKAKVERAAAKAADADTPEEKAAKEAVAAIGKDEKARESIAAELVKAQSKVNDLQGQLDTLDAKVNADAQAAMTVDERNESARAATKAAAAELRGGPALL